MRNTYLVFLRDYLGYVQAWGFWLGLLSMPLLILFGAFVGGLAASSSPVRYYTIVEDTPLYGPALQAEFKQSSEEMREALQTMTGIEALEGGTTAAAETALASLARFIQIPAPANTLEELRPWLLGDRLISGPDGEKSLFAAIIVDPETGDLQYWSVDATVSGLLDSLNRTVEDTTRAQFLRARNIDPGILEQADQTAPDIMERLVRSDKEAANIGAEITLADRAPRYIAIGLSYMLWFIIFSAGQYLLMGTIEERGNKIFDSLLTAIRLPQLLAGKLMAVLAVTVTMFSAWFLVGGAFLALGVSQMPDETRQSIQQIVSAGLDISIVVPTLISFILGYLIYGVIFLALGSLCDTIQEAQTLLSPMLILLMLPMVGIIFALEDPNSSIVAGASWIPLFTPFLLILRIPAEPPVWEIFAQITLMLVTAATILWLATKVYRAGAVHGAGVNDAVKWLKGFFPGKKSAAKN